MQGQGHDVQRAGVRAGAVHERANTGEIKEQTVFMGDFPMMTETGTFIVNGTERVVVSTAGPQPRRDLRARRALPPA